MRRMSVVLAAIAISSTTPAAAVVVASSLPFFTNPDWSQITTGGAATITQGAGESIITTTNSRGVWFGWFNAVGTPSWTIADNGSGNYLSLSTRFSVGADDWYAFLNDGTRRAQMKFNATNCNAATTNCYAFSGTPGVTIDFDGSSTFIALDTTQYRTYEFLLLGSEVIYRIDGVRYAGTAAADTAAKILLMGDRTGSSQSGTGQMFVNAVSFDSGTALTDLTGTAVPEPASWAMLVAGFGLAGAAMRRRRAVQISA